MKYKHKNIGQFPIRIWDVDGTSYSLLPGDECTLSVKRINGDLMIEENDKETKTNKRRVIKNDS